MYITAKTDNAQQNSKCKFPGDRHNIFNYTISECSKLV